MARRLPAPTWLISSDLKATSRSSFDDASATVVAITSAQSRPGLTAAAYVSCQVDTRCPACPASRSAPGFEQLSEPVVLGRVRGQVDDQVGDAEVPAVGQPAAQLGQRA